MNTLDKIMVSIFSASLGVALLQHQIVKSKKTSANSMEQTRLEVRSSEEKKTPDSLSSSPVFYHEVHWKIDATRDRSVSFNDKKQAAISASLQRELPEQTKFPADYDFFRAREEMKDRLFYSDDVDAEGMTDAQKWKLIGSKARPW